MAVKRSSTLAKQFREKMVGENLPAM